MVLHLGVCLFIGLWLGWDQTGLESRIGVMLVGGGFWAALMLPVNIGPRREVTFGPGVLIVRTWLEALLGRAGTNQWIGPDDAWLWRGRGGTCLLLPDGPRLGPQSRPLLEAFGRAGFRVEDEASRWQSLHPGIWRGSIAMFALGVAAMVAGMAVSLLTGEPDPVIVAGIAGVPLITASQVLLFVSGGRPRLFL